MIKLLILFVCFSLEAQPLPLLSPIVIQTNKPIKGTFSWHSVYGAQGYTILFSKDKTNWIEAQRTTRTNATITISDTNRTYWAVEAYTNSPMSVIVTNN